MNKFLSSKEKHVSGSETCTLFAVMVAFFAVVILWQVVTVLQGSLGDLQSLQGLTALNK